MDFLIDKNTQTRIATLVDHAVQQVLRKIVNHGNEEGMTAALGQALMQQRINEANLKVDFNYRQHSKNTEEPHSGADGNFLVRVTTPSDNVVKASLFQAKLLRGYGEVRSLSMPKSEAGRLRQQSEDMLKHTGEAVAVFYTHKNIYVVDAEDYGNGPESTTPLSQGHRLITLGTYLGRWMPRCTKGDKNSNLVKRASHLDGFKDGLTLDIVSKQPSVPWEQDLAEDAWRKRR